MSGGRTPLSPAERAALLHLARRAVAARVEGGPAPPLPEGHPRLLQPRGAFVTLKLDGALRGCIGMIQPRLALAESVLRSAAAAATEDPRFPPLGRQEIDRVRIEISALEAPFRVLDRGQVVPGRHGLIVTRGRRRGLLLPQVAAEQGWDARTFVEETCLKAGLPPNACEEGGVLEAFEAEVFGEL